MKSIASILATAALLGASFNSAIAAEDSAPLVARLSKVSAQLEADGNSVVFARVKYIFRDSDSPYTITLEKGATYTAHALGDDGRVDLLDLIVTDEKDAEVAKHETEANAATVTFTPKASGTYCFNIKAGHINKKFNDGMTALVVARANNGKESATSASMLTSLARLMVQSSANNNDLFISQIEAIDRGTTVTLSYGLGNRHEFSVIAMGDGERVLDLDLRVEDENGNVIGADETDSNTGIVKFAPKSPGRFKVIVRSGAWKKNAAGGHFGIIIMSSLKSDPQSIASK